ncbi:zinc-binding alcohol dehydrogenase family protein [Albibacterium sp.]|uniref:zinc-binding alcohol dehydrogenase family protein n=1 Tax=Albibacterium sp. TaxID=2952885 RepID=UPI002C5396C0|nr:zinc-binding alcohol dehydrogenase family protein [Albibacterium sp.]HUH19416.1 zinc-binding alcohol dehydrogenase family protein [Albibacterium sp.]
MKMDSLVCTKPGKFEYKQSSRPILTENNAIIKIKKIGICGTDLHAFQGTQPFFDYPRILGHEISGELIEADNAPGFTIGEAVTFIPYVNCGNCLACNNGRPNCCVNLKVCGVHMDGGMVEYLSVPSRLLVHGNGMSYDELALVEPLAIGAHGVRRAAIVENEFVLVIGAGPIGLGAMEFARIAGARVIAMDIKENRLAFCKEKLGFEYTVDARFDAKLQISEITGNEMPTVVIDATGNQSAINSAFQYMAHGARFVLIGLQKKEISFSHPEFHKREGTLMSSRNATKVDFEHVIDSMKKGLIDPKNYITHRVNFSSLADEFNSWLDPNSTVIKAIASL